VSALAAPLPPAAADPSTEFSSYAQRASYGGRSSAAAAPTPLSAPPPAQPLAGAGGSGSDALSARTRPGPLVSKGSGSRFDLVDGVSGSEDPAPLGSSAPPAAASAAAEFVKAAMQRAAAPPPSAAVVRGVVAPPQVPLLPPRTQLLPPVAPSPQAAPTSMRPEAASAAAAAAAAATPELQLTRANLQSIVELLSSAGDRGAQMKGLHFIGRAADIRPLPTNSAAPPPTMRALPVGPLPALPLIHSSDAVWLSLFDRAVSGVIQFLAGLLGPGSAAAAAVAALSPRAAGGSAAAEADARAALIRADGIISADTSLAAQTALSVIRKLFRNCASYVAPKAGVVFAGMERSVVRNLHRALATTPRSACSALTQCFVSHGAAPRGLGT
jgi:hypothetical protein